ncbi:hypothetical protein Salat_2705600 [Sesamum alatum]|uniref:CCHC-type domain-containing protein n=1 Tax=Sesamum alatum TaxID=300844 RepID=A0AAE2CBG4_9LAMI|nr:hypothetical protein Salat_2705600 [Sesamum alatum]
MDVRRPLKRFLTVRSSTREEIMVSFSYERLPNFCYICGVLGHIAHNCTQQFEVGFYDPKVETQYGPWLRSTVIIPRFRQSRGEQQTTGPAMNSMTWTLRNQVRAETEPNEEGNHGVGCGADNVISGNEGRRGSNMAGERVETEGGTTAEIGEVVGYHRKQLGWEME